MTNWYQTIWFGAFAAIRSIVDHGVIQRATFCQMTISKWTATNVLLASTTLLENIPATQQSSNKSIIESVATGSNLLHQRFISDGLICSICWRWLLQNTSHKISSSGSLRIKLFQLTKMAKQIWLLCVRRYSTIIMVHTCLLLSTSRTKSIHHGSLSVHHMAILSKADTSTKSITNLDSYQMKKFLSLAHAVHQEWLKVRRRMLLDFRHTRLVKLIEVLSHHDLTVKEPELQKKHVKSVVR